MPVVGWLVCWCGSFLAAVSPSDAFQDLADQQKVGGGEVGIQPQSDERDVAVGSLTVRPGPWWDQVQAAGPFQRPFLLEIKGVIDSTTLRFVQSGLRQAQAWEADLIVVQIESPGGGAVESMEIADLLSQVRWARTVAWVPREAISGGAVIALGCEVLVMQPGATIGDIGVIQLDPTMMVFRYAPAKIRSTLVAKVRALSERYDRSPELAEAMVDELAVVYQQRSDPNQFRLISLGAPDELDLAGPRPGNPEVVDEELPGGWVLVAETRPGRFLTLSHRRAQQLGVSQSSADSLDALREQLNVTGPWTVRSYGFTDHVVDFLNNPWITGLLLIVGIIALFVEISNPGISVGGLLALLCFSLFFWSHFAGGTAGWLEVILFVTGVLFILAEVFLIPGLGLPALMGIGLILLSLVMATLDFMYPSSPAQWDQLSRSLLTVLVAGLVGGVGVAVVFSYMGSLPALNRLTLTPPQFADDPTAAKKDGGSAESSPMVVTQGRAAGLRVGDQGVTESVLRPAGRASIQGRSVDVVADGKFIEPGVAIKVIEIRGNRLIVVPIQPLDQG